MGLRTLGYLWVLTLWLGLVYLIRLAYLVWREER